MKVFYVVLGKTSIMMLLMAIGYLFGRKKVLSANAGRDLAILETRFLLPAYIFITLAQNVVPEKLSVNAKYLLWGLVFLGIVLLLSFILSRFIPGNRLDRLMAYYLLAFPNFGYFGYPVVQAAFGGEVLSQFIIFALPFTITLNTYGAYILTTQRNADGKKASFTFKNLRSLPLEVLAAVLLGLLVGLLRIPLPGVITDFFEFSSACMSPISMLLAGLILSALSLGKLFNSLRAYIVSALKVIILPLIIGAAAYLCGLRGFELIFPTVLCCMPVGMNVVIFSRPEQPDYTSSIVTCFISYIFALPAVPVIMALITAIS